MKYESDIEIKEYSTIDTLLQSSSLQSIPSIKEPTKIQSIRTTSITQHSNNPFQKKNATGSMQITSEFINYKPMISEKIDEEEYLELRDKTTHKKELLKKKSELSSDTLKELESDMGLELLMGTYVSAEMEKEILLLPKIELVTEKDIAAKILKLPPSTHKNTLILDLDETLTHTLLVQSFAYQAKENAEIIKFIDKEKKQISIQVMKRPFLEMFLKTVASLFELVVC